MQHESQCQRRACRQEYRSPFEPEAGFVACRAADLVDEFRVWVFPLVLGKGKRLFENGVPPRGLTLVESRRTPNGVLLNTYRPAGPVRV